jgi:hypothetical protein
LPKTVTATTLERACPSSFDPSHPAALKRTCRDALLLRCSSDPDNSAGWATGHALLSGVSSANLLISDAPCRTHGLVSPCGLRKRAAGAAPNRRTERRNPGGEIDPVINLSVVSALDPALLAYRWLKTKLLRNKFVFIAAADVVPAKGWNAHRPRWDCLAIQSSPPLRNQRF